MYNIFKNKLIFTCYCLILILSLKSAIPGGILLANEFVERQKKAGLALAEEVKKGNPIDEKLFEKYRKCDGLTLAGLVKDGKITPSKLLDIALFRTEAVQPKNNSEKEDINAVIYLEEMKEQAHLTAESDLPNGTFKGVPFLLKDSAEMADTPFSKGSKAYKAFDFTSKEDSDIVKCYKDAGLVIFGKTNMPEFALKGETNPEAWGRTLNPWNPEYSPGGSSGGSAAAVAAGIVPIAHGSDKGGSIRIPASCTGLFGLKPSNLRINGKEFGSNHVLSRSVRDSAAMLDVVLSRPPKRSFLEEVNKGKEEINDRSKKRFKIMYWAPENNNPYDVTMKGENAVQEAVQETVTLLRNLGHDLEKEEGPIISVDQYNDFAEIGFLALCLKVEEIVGKLISDVRKKFEKLNEEEEGVEKKVDVDEKVEEAVRNLELETKYALKLAEEIKRKHMALIGKYVPLEHDIIEKVNKVFEEEKNEREEDKVYDFYLTPTLARFPFENEELNRKPWEQNLMQAVVDQEVVDDNSMQEAFDKMKKDNEFPEEVKKEMEQAITNGVTNLSEFVLTSESKVHLKIARLKERLSLAPWAFLANMAGNPAMSVPLHWAEEESLPVGIQFMAAYGREDLLFRLAGQLEEAEASDVCTMIGAGVSGTRSSYVEDKSLTKKASLWFGMVPPLHSP